MGGQAKAKKQNKPKRKDTKPHEENRMTPQERMKAKMHEKAKKKTAEKYTVDQLLEKTEERIDNFDFDMARLFCQRALDIEPTNLSILDMLGNICAELGDVCVFLKALELSPEEGHSKYMYLGQIHTGMEAVRYFSKGIELMLNTMDKLSNEASAFGAAAFPSDGDITKKDVSVAFCSIAEIFFTDLCMEEGAADRCKEALDKALHYDEHNPEALQLMASYLFSIEKTEEGRVYLKKSVSSWLPSLQKEEESEERAEQDMEEDEDQTKVWYLLGWLFYLQLDKQDLTNSSTNFRKSALTHLTKAKKLYVKLRCEDAPMMEHTEHLLAELGGEAHEAEDDEAGPSLEDIEDDFIQSSDEEEDAMDH
ncbi:putative UPF0661 TPR repeat-containing protein C16D10.01c [Triplophysa rosa]|uniref:UPF0661 TPR repeat-containing protein C16D10.01c n=1 Tax=Triplophysa rosa TaxID=992332 RepID=A0A9W7WR22_TRIRA|nr:putative UPF0661 TPR repeat-containing protein C16D10.01c [Triplophysa rosa]